jgi:hypothetical protein
VLVNLRNTYFQAEGGERLGVMLASGTVPIVLRALSSPAAMEHAPVALAALGLLGGIARGEGLEALRTGGAFASAVELLGAHAEDIAVRAATAELIQRLATDDLISSFSKSLADFATRLQLGQTTDGEMRAIPQLALGLGALAMIPENIPKIQVFEFACTAARTEKLFKMIAGSCPCTGSWRSSADADTHGCSDRHERVSESWPIVVDILLLPVGGCRSSRKQGTPKEQRCDSYEALRHD